jgi:hypothetical protein
MAADLMKRLKPLLDAGIDLAQMTPTRAEAVVRELVRRGEVRRHEADELLALLVERGKGATGQVVGVLRSEAAKQVERLIERVAHLEQRVEALTTLLGRSGAKAPRGTSPMTEPEPASSPAAKKVAAKKVAAQKAPAKKTQAKSPAKKTAAKKTAAKKTSQQKSPAKQTGSKSAQPGRAGSR